LACDQVFTVEKDIIDKALVERKAVEVEEKVTDNDEVKELKKTK